jgi:poly(3-hydroxybutyrate) depolymerase
MRRRPGHSRAAALALACLAGAAAHAATSIPAGESSFTFVDARGQPDRPIPVYTYRPASCDAACPLVIVMHGVTRDASNYRGFWERSAEQYRLVIAAPEFSKQAWPHAAAYNLGDIAAHPADPSKWSYAAVEHLFDEIAEGRKGYVLFGHSAGGQFVHRMALFLPGSRAAMMVAANPGWYTMPEWRADRARDPYPYSLVGCPAGEADLRQSFARPFTLMLGTRDVDAHDKDLNRSAGAEREGPNRFERGQAYFAAARAAAKDLDARFAWKRIEVPGVAHSGSRMSRAAADYLFGKAG